MGMHPLHQDKFLKLQIQEMFSLVHCQSRATEPQLLHNHVRRLPKVALI